ncbi:hypothetical protein MSAN_00202800 [Mycena sanguinolenta]|uniref:DUF6534 domain-containing protein n=1 Tax=Mycena sanguinolenta TaxID=230812 RepID=A0A8H6ZI56_9AGAR|nr:hypothetical protein MSAN_00202800 [Mycena sanguinolenta]
MATPLSVKIFLGPMFVGTCLSTWLFGVCTSQFTTYFLSTRQAQDSFIIRALVVWEFSISVFSTVTSIYFVWLYLVENYFNPAFLASAPWPLTVIPLLSALSACPVEIFMAYRILRFSRSRLVFGLLVFLTASNGAIAFATSVLAFGMPFDEESRLAPIVDSWLGITVANDVAVTLFLIYYLHKSRTGFGRTNTVIGRLIRSAVESAAFASFFSVMVSIMFTLLPRAGLHLVFSQPMGRIYTSTLLSTLNGRDELRNELARSYEFGESLSLSPAVAQNRVAVQITQNTELHDFATSSKHPMGV